MSDPGTNELSVDQVHPAMAEKARRLRVALAQTWPRLKEAILSRSEIARRGRIDYERAFEEPITERGWRDLVRRIQERGGGSGESDPLEAYIDGRAGKFERPKPSQPVGSEDLASLGAYLSTIPDPSAITPTERPAIWHQIFMAFAEGVRDGRPEASWRKAIIRFVLNEVPGFSASAKSLKRTWQSNYRLWIEAGGKLDPLKDGRARSRRQLIPECDVETLQRVATFETGGRLAQALRLARARGELSPEFQERFSATASRKSRVPDAVIREVAPMLETLQLHRRGPYRAKSDGAYITRDWTKVPSGAWYQADDVTLPVYYWIQDIDGPRLMRGQCLVMVDLRSRRILDFALIDETSYNALCIRRLMFRVCERFGLPTGGFYFENGIWKVSKLVKGGPLPSLPEIETGFSSIGGIRFIHAKTPRAKVVERVLGMIQDRMEGVPGYVGRNEVTDRFELVHKAKLKASGGANPKHPASLGFLSRDEWASRLQETCEQYNAEPQESLATLGLSPDQAWEKFMDLSNPPIGICPEARYLLSTERRVVRVSRNGIRVDIGKKAFVYRNEETGKRIGQQLLAWWDTESPDFLTVTEMDRKNPFTVPIEMQPTAVGATHDEMKAAMRSIDAHNRHARELYSKIRATFIPTKRRTVVAPDVERVGFDLAKSREDAIAAQVEQRSTGRDLRKGFKEAGLQGYEALAETVSHDPDRSAAMKQILDFIKKD